MPINANHEISNLSPSLACMQNLVTFGKLSNMDQSDEGGARFLASSVATVTLSKEKSNACGRRMETHILMYNTPGCTLRFGLN